MYYSKEEIENMTVLEKMEKLFDYADYGVGQFEEMQQTINALRGIVIYLCLELKVDNETLHDLYMRRIPNKYKDNGGK